MFANYSLVQQIVCWGIFMGLNGFVGGTVPFANLAVFGFAGILGFKYGGWFTALACVTFLLEFLGILAQAFVSSGKDIFFIQSNMGMINFVIALIVLFVLIFRAKSVLPGPVWVTMGIAYLLGLGVSMLFWNPIFAVLAIVSLTLMCTPSAVTGGVVMGVILWLGYLMFLVPVIYYEHIR